MRIRNFDIEERINNLCLEIKHLVEDNNINKEAVIEDFKDLINGQFFKEEEEENESA